MTNIELTTDHPAATTVISLPDLNPDHGDLCSFVKQHARGAMSYLLAHADDGVIWGKIDCSNNETMLALAPGSVPLNWLTLHTLRLFNRDFELLIWNSGAQWCARTIEDSQSGGATWQESYDEQHLLWGTHCAESRNGFSLLTHGIEGLRHAVPLSPVKCKEGSDTLAGPIALLVRHYLNARGPARIEASRLIDIIQI